MAPPIDTAVVLGLPRRTADRHRAFAQPGSSTGSGAVSDRPVAVRDSLPNSGAIRAADGAL